jgi:NAD(P)H-hydrate epimerase
MTGGARLAARAARRIGAGLVTIACAAESFAIYAADAPGLLVQPLGGATTLPSLLADERLSAVLVGPGGGRTPQTRAATLAALASGRPCVLDADALSVFAGEPAALFEAIRGACLMTPHEGELRRLLPSAADLSCKLDRARALAASSGAVVLLKGADTVIAAPDGIAAINADAPPWLATAGAGDVLAGAALGFVAQGMAPFQAAAAAAWLHGAAADRVGAGLIAEDLPELLPRALGRLLPAAPGDRRA